MELLADHAGFWVDGGHDCWREESKSLYGDIVEQEDESCCINNWIENSQKHLLCVEFVQYLRC